MKKLKHNEAIAATTNVNLKEDIANLRTYFESYDALEYHILIDTSWDATEHFLDSMRPIYFLEDRVTMLTQTQFDAQRKTFLKTLEGMGNTTTHERFQAEENFNQLYDFVKEGAGVLVDFETGWVNLFFESGLAQGIFLPQEVQWNSLRFHSVTEAFYKSFEFFNYDHGGKHLTLEEFEQWIPKEIALRKVEGYTEADLTILKQRYENFLKRAKQKEHKESNLHVVYDQSETPHIVFTQAGAPTVLRLPSD